MTELPPSFQRAQREIEHARILRDTLKDVPLIPPDFDSDRFIELWDEAAQRPSPYDEALVQANHLVQARSLLIGRDGPNCYLCGVECGEKGHIDHIIPRAHGGTDAAENLGLACKTCNTRKSDMVVSLDITSGRPRYHRLRKRLVRKR